MVFRHPHQPSISPLGTSRPSTRVTALLAVGLLSSCGDIDSPQHNEAVGEASAGAVVCADDDVVEGIDVSHWQATIDWQAVTQTDVVFAIARTNDGSVMDSQFEANWPGIKNAGLLRGVYQYFHPGGDPVEQAGILVDKVGILGPGDLPAVIDVETTDGEPPSVIAANIAIWMDLVEAGTGRRPFIYTGSYFWNDHVQSSQFADDSDLLWIAHYTQNCPNLPTPWSRWAFWQYTSSGSVSGIWGNVDRNLFNGSLLELHDLAANGYRAEVVSLTYSHSMIVGSSDTVTLVVDNVGARPWPSTTYLGTTMPRDRNSDFATTDWIDDNRPAALSTIVNPGESATVQFALQAPLQPGDYQEHFNLLVNEVTWFSDINPGGGPRDDEIVLNITVEPTTGQGGGAGNRGQAGAGGENSGAGEPLRGIPNSGGNDGCAVSLEPPPALPLLWWIPVLTWAWQRRRYQDRNR